MINTVSTESNLSGLNKEDFQKDINNKKTDLFILKNAQGMEVAVTNYGCAILSIMIPDKNGKYANVILGRDKTASGYITESAKRVIIVLFQYYRIHNLSLIHI